jgi:beta-lactamase class A
MTLMEKLARGEAVDRAASAEMIAVLERQQFNDRIPAGLPAGTRVAHKTGEITKIQHDAAIVYADRPFVLVVLVRGIDDVKRGSALIADIARVLYGRMILSPLGGGGAIGAPSTRTIVPRVWLTIYSSPFASTPNELTFPS